MAVDVQWHGDSSRPLKVVWPAQSDDPESSSIAVEFTLKEARRIREVLNAQLPTEDPVRGALRRIVEKVARL